MKMKRGALHAYVAEHQNNIRGIVAARHGQTLYSDYWGGFGPDDTLHIMSVTKSVVSLLVGIAIDQGLIRGVSQRVLDFFPEYEVKRGEKTIREVTIEHLLTMTAPYKYKSEPWTKVCTSPDWTKAALDILGGRGGITGEFKYSTLGVHILTGIISKASGMTTVEYANRYLFLPLGIAPHSSFVAQTAEEHKAFIMSKEPRGNIWFSDPLGVATAGYGLCLSALDMAKLGQLCLDCGRGIVSPEWISESTRPRVHSGEAFGGMSYGYMWWTPVGGSPACAALGNGGNVIYIDPDCDTVVAVNCVFKPRVLDRVQFIREYVEPLLDDAEQG